MKCPHCAVALHPDWECGRINPKSSKFDADEYYGYSDGIPKPDIAWVWWAMECPQCDKTIIDVGLIDTEDPIIPLEKERAYPKLAARKSIEGVIPESFKSDYLEACNVLSVSVKASAALSRRVLESILDHQGYSGRDLDKKIEAALKETAVHKVLPLRVRETIDAVRNVGNFAAHPITDTKGLRIIDVDVEEAEWCLDIVEQLFEHYYGEHSPETEQMIAKLEAKLDDAGKPSRLGQKTAKTHE